jgi:hypothetical protein
MSLDVAQKDFAWMIFFESKDEQKLKNNEEFKKEHNFEQE